jgi:hypothetical protein
LNYHIFCYTFYTRKSLHFDNNMGKIKVLHLLLLDVVVKINGLINILPVSESTIWKCVLRDTKLTSLHRAS